MPEPTTGHLDVLLLAALAGGPAHGYAVIESLRQRSVGALALAQGTVYPALHRLEREGLLTSRWSTDAPRRRRVYELTSRGRASLADNQERWAVFSHAVDRILKGVQWPSLT